MSPPATTPPAADEPPWVKEIREVQKGVKEHSAVGRVAGLEERDGLLMKDGVFVIPPRHPYLKRVLEAAHATPMAGHRSVPATVARMRTVLYSPGLTAWVAEQLRSCEQCIRAKVDTTRRQPLQAIETPARPMRTLHADAVFLPSTGEFDKAWVVIDRFTHFVFLFPASTSDTAERTAERFFVAVVTWFGIPDIIFTDQDPLFTSTFTQALAKRMRIDWPMSTAGRKQANGLVERQNRTLREYLRVFAGRYPTAWPSLLPTAQFAFNSAANASTGLAPLALLLGGPPRGPWSLPGEATIARADSFFEEKARL